jgi:hypothetical protein
MRRFWVKFVDAATSKLMIALLTVAFIFSLGYRCSKNPGEPPPTPDPCLECPPVFIEVPGDTVFVDVPGDTVVVEVPVICSQFDATAEFTVIKDQSGPNDYLIVAEGYPDELVSITDTAPAPVDTSFTRVFPNYTGGRISIKKVSGSKAEAIGVAIIDLRCSE